MYKISKHSCPSMLKLIFENYVISHEHHTRKLHKYSVPFLRLTICQKSIKYKGIIVWNYIVDNLIVPFIQETLEILYYE